MDQKGTNIKTEAKDEGFYEHRGPSSSPLSSSSSASSFSTSSSSTKKQQPSSGPSAEGVSYMSSTTIFALHHSVTVVGGKNGGGDSTRLSPDTKYQETMDPGAQYQQKHFADAYSMEPLFNEIPYYPSQSCSSSYYNGLRQNYLQNNFQNSSSVYYDNNNNKNCDEFGKCCERMDQRQIQEQKCCRCVIDISTPATLERDFYAWLNGSDHDGREKMPHMGSPCLFLPSAASSSYSYSNYTSQYCYPLNSSSFSKEEHDITRISNNSFSNACTTMYDPGGDFENILSPTTTTASNSTFDAISSSSSCISPLSANNNFVRGRFNSFSTISPSTTATATAIVTNANATKSVNNGNNSNNLPVKPQLNRREFSKKYTTEKGLHRGTNLYGRPYCPGRPLSMEERAQIINLFHGGMKVNAISKRLCISHGCVSKIITRFRETGLLIPSSHSECRRRKRLLAAAQQQQHYHQQQLLLQQQQEQHQQLLQQQKQFLIQQQQQQQQAKKIKSEH